MYGVAVDLFFFFFSSRRRHTRYWRDWSSDVCSSDLLAKSRSGAPPVSFAPAGSSARVASDETWPRRAAGRLASGDGLKGRGLAGGIFIALRLLSRAGPSLHLLELVGRVVGHLAGALAVDDRALEVEGQGALERLHRGGVLAQLLHHLAELVVGERRLRVELGRPAVGLRGAQGLFESRVAVADLDVDFGR